MSCLHFLQTNLQLFDEISKWRVVLNDSEKISSNIAKICGKQKKIKFLLLPIYKWPLLEPKMVIVALCTSMTYILGIQIRNSKMDLNIVELTKGAEIFTDHNALIRF